MEILNPQQLEAINCTQGAVLVSAGAGTGKTRVLTYRVANLINECGIKAHNILAITFTNKATLEMKERILDLCKEQGEEVTVSTFHSLAARILRTNIHLLGENYNRFFTIYDDADRKKVIKKIFKSLEESESCNDLEDYAAEYISKAKNDGVLPPDFMESYGFIRSAPEVKKIYELYEAELAKSNGLDFDDLILKTIELFKKFPLVLEYYQNLWQYIHVDEFQDTNKTQYLLVKMLAAKHKNVLVVGDEDQSIYAFRGANYKNLNDFKQEFAHVKVFKLERNYRSTKRIIEKANKLINQNVERSESKNLFTENEQGEDICYKVCDSDYSEADFIADEIRHEYRSGTPLSKIAVIFRINALSRTFENTLVKNNLPYILVKGVKFYERAEIKSLLAYLRLLVNPADREALIRVINFPKRGVGDATIEKLERAAEEKRITMLEAATDFPHKGVEEFAKYFRSFKEAAAGKGLNETAQLLVEMLNPKEIYNNRNEEDETRLLNIKSFLVGVNEYCENNENAELIDFLENVNLDSVSTAQEDGEAVVVSTVHGVKGLEFDIVFIAAFEEGMMPYRRGIEEGALEEERRLAYVAITRARRKLYITRARSRFSFGSGGSYTMNSRFLAEMGIKADTEEEIFNKSFYNEYSYKKTPYEKAQVK